MEYLEIRLRSDLCAGNGESVGNSIDTDVCMDAVGLPYIPSRRIKGCLRQAACDLQKMGYPEASQKNIDSLFGDAFGQEGCFFIENAVIEGAASIRKYLQSEVPSVVKAAAHSSNIERLFTTVRGQTRLEDGVKVDNSLRFTRVISHYDPLEPEEKKEMCFQAPFFLETDNSALIDLFDACCKATRHIGTNRNRGLGNVRISICGKKEDKQNKQNNKLLKQEIQDVENKNIEHHTNLEEYNSDQCVISYTITLDSPVTLPGCDELNTAIPARSVIGCMAGNYLKAGNASDETFNNLFLNGTVRWSALTPVIEGAISDPVPMMLVKLKNNENRKINHLVEETDNWKTMKPKTMDGSFAAVVEKKETREQVYFVAEPEIHTVYHNSINRKAADFAEDSQNSLYMQDSIDAGMIYGGTVTCPKYMENLITLCLKTASLRFGRSRSAQYAACSLKEIVKVEKKTQNTVKTQKEEVVYVILKSDLIYSKNGAYTTDSGDIRSAIADKLALSSDHPEHCIDYCRYHTIGGYQSVWQLQKPQIPAVKAGSIYCFKSNGETLPEEIIIGGFSQEGMGVCRITTREKLMNITKVRAGEIDRVEADNKQDRKDKIYTELLVLTGIETMQRYALDHLDEMPANLPIARLRLMLSEADSYENLQKLINGMKESDVSSEKVTSKREDSTRFLESIYGKMSSDEEKSSGKKKSEDTDSSKKRILKKILQSETGLWEAVEKNQTAENILMKKWKLPLEILLHAQHYRKER